MSSRPSTSEQSLLTATVVASRLHVTPTTVRRWAKAKLIPYIELPSGQLRFRESDVAGMLRDSTDAA